MIQSLLSILRQKFWKWLLNLGMYFIGAKSDPEHSRFLNLEIILTLVITVSVQPSSAKKLLLLWLFLMAKTWKLCLGWGWMSSALELKVPLPQSFSSRDLLGCSASASRFLWHRQPRVLFWGLTPINVLLKVEQVSQFPFRPGAVFCKTSVAVTMPAQEEGGSLQLQWYQSLHWPKAKLEETPLSSCSLSISHSARTGWEATHSPSLACLWQPLPRPGISTRISPAAAVILCSVLN